MFSLLEQNKLVLSRILAALKGTDIDLLSLSGITIQIEEALGMVEPSDRDNIKLLDAPALDEIEGGDSSRVEAEGIDDDDGAVVTSAIAVDANESTGSTKKPPTGKQRKRKILVLSQVTSLFQAVNPRLAPTVARPSQIRIGTNAVVGNVREVR